MNSKTPNLDHLTPGQTNYRVAEQDTERHHVRGFNTLRLNWNIWKWAMLKRGGGWEAAFERGMKLLVREVVQDQIARRRPIPPDVAGWLGKD